MQMNALSAPWSAQRAANKLKQLVSGLVEHARVDARRSSFPLEASVMNRCYMYEFNFLSQLNLVRICNE